MHATYNKVNETCPNHNRHYFNVLLYMPCSVSKDHWHLSVLFAPVECKCESECECKCKQSNCNIFRIARIHIAKPIYFISYVLVCANNENVSIANAMHFFLWCVNWIFIVDIRAIVCAQRPHASHLIRTDPIRTCKCSKNWFSQRTTCNFSLYFNVAVVIAWKCRIDSQWKSPNCFEIVRKKPVSYCYIVKRLQIDCVGATF